jgi:hypothetical protein
MSERPLPYGWIREVDGNSGHPFYVDTKATPPRSIWVHPFEDEQYLREHPDAGEKADHKPSQSYSAPATPPVASSSDRAGYAAPGGKPEKRGILTKLGLKKTKEEREMEKRHKEEQRRQMLEVTVRLAVTSHPKAFSLLVAGTTPPRAAGGTGGNVSAAAATATDVPAAAAVSTAVRPTVWRRVRSPAATVRR